MNVTQDENGDWFVYEEGGTLVVGPVTESEAKDRVHPWWCSTCNEKHTPPATCP